MLFYAKTFWHVPDKAEARVRFDPLLPAAAGISTTHTHTHTHTHTSSIMHLFSKDDTVDTSDSTNLTSSSANISFWTAKFSAEFAAGSHMP